MNPAMKKEINWYVFPVDLINLRGSDKLIIKSSRGSKMIVRN